MYNNFYHDYSLYSKHYPIIIKCILIYDIKSPKYLNFQQIISLFLTIFYKKKSFPTIYRINCLIYNHKLDKNFKNFTSKYNNYVNNDLSDEKSILNIQEGLISFDKISLLIILQRKIYLIKIAFKYLELKDNIFLLLFVFQNNL